MVAMGDSYSQRKELQPAFPEFAVCRILDANLDRAREGLRIIEEWCRFGLNQAALAAECKQLRQELARWHGDDLRAARDTPNDLGTELTHPQEEHRSSVAQVLRVNFCRVQEALRVLEEYGKIYSAEMGSACKQMRYRVYTLESQLGRHQRFQLLQQSHLYLITAPMVNLVETVEAALQGGVTLVQYRDKDADDLTRLHHARSLKHLCHRYGALFWSTIASIWLWPWMLMGCTWDSRMYRSPLPVSCSDPSASSGVRRIAPMIYSGQSRKEPTISGWVRCMKLPPKPDDRQPGLSMCAMLPNMRLCRGLLSAALIPIICTKFCRLEQSGCLWCVPLCWQNSPPWRLSFSCHSSIACKRSSVFTLRDERG
jgi:hypothetical protein